MAERKGFEPLPYPIEFMFKAKSASLCPTAYPTKTFLEKQLNNCKISQFSRQVNIG